VKGRAPLLPIVASAGAVVAATGMLRWLHVESSATVALAYLLVVLFVASYTNLVLAVATSLAATLAVNYFFLPPVGTFTIADTHNWIALGAFLVVSVVASNLSATARNRTREAIDRRNEVTRLFDLSRDVLLTTDSDAASASLARHVARRFELSMVTIAVPTERGDWDLVHGGEEIPDIETAELDRAWAATRGGLEFDAKTRSYGGHRTVSLPSGTVRVVPVRVGLRPVGIAVLGGRAIEPGTADAIAGLMAIAIERSRLLEERRVAELAHQRADLSSALLAALGHDLRTPLTAIRVATANAGDSRLSASGRAEQAALALSEIDHLSRLLQEILDMARIEARAVHADREWVSAGAIVEAATAHAGSTLARHSVLVEADEETQVQVDPRLTSAALAHILENAARYSPAGATIRVRAVAGDDGLRITVDDEGSGFDRDNLDRLFEPFVRGTSGSAVPTGTGLGLAITRGLLAAEGGRVWAENGPAGGGRIAIHVPCARRPTSTEDSWS
jgi:two-component system, OmpR family, sensor histidine kinase KdpD